MEKKSKKSIIIGVTSLLLVTLILLGLTYAYYRTRIVGNENDTSISVTSKKLEVKYQNESAYIEATGIEPGYSATKTFEVHNSGNEPAYYSIILDEITNTFARTQDWTYTLTKGGSEVSKGTIVSGSYQILVGKETIEAGTTNEYELTVNYANLEDVDQSEDMGKELTLRVNISDETVTWDNATEGTLLYAIKTNNTVTAPLTIPAQEKNLETEAVLASTEDDYGISYYFRGMVENNYVNFADMCWRIVRITGDGRIKLILEDKNTTCDDTETAETTTMYTGDWSIGTGNSGYTKYEIGELTASDGVTTNKSAREIRDYLHGETESDFSMATAFKNFQETFTNEELSKLKSGDWCLGDRGYSRSRSISSDYTYTLLTDLEILDRKVVGGSINNIYYDSYVRLSGENKDGYQPTLKCNGTIMNDWDDDEMLPTPMYVSAITADEIIYAGGKYDEEYNNFYLLNENFKSGNTEYHFITPLSPCYFNASGDYGFILDWTGSMTRYSVATGDGFRPVVALASNTVITEGVGTLSSPYIIG